MSQFFLMQDDILDGNVATGKLAYEEFVHSNSSLRNSLSAEYSDISSNVSKETQAQIKLAGTIASLQAVNSANIAIMKTTFPTHEFTEDWFNTTKKNYNTIKESSVEWCTSIAPAITSTIPSSIIEYNPKFQFFSKEIIAVIDSSLSAGEKKKHITGYIQELLKKTKEVSEDFSAYSHIENGQSVGVIPSWSKKIITAGNDFNDNNADIKNNRFKELYNDIDYNVKINKAIEQEIAKYNNLVITGGVLVVGGAFIAGSIGYPLVFSHPVAGGIVIVIGIGCMVAGAVLMGVYIDKIKEKYREKAAVEMKISYDNQLLSALINLEHTTNVLDNCHSIMLSETGNFITSWNNISKKFNNVIKNLENGSEYNMHDYLIGVKMELETSMPLWQSVYEYSLQLENSLVLQEQVIDLNTNIQ